MIEIPDGMTRIDVQTQADVDRLVPPALAERKRVALVCTPTEPLVVDTIQNEDLHPWTSTLNPHQIAWLIVRGGDDPMHPDWVRSLRDQAVAAGVPFALEWGEWAPSCNFSGDDRAGCEIGYFAADGRFVLGVKPYEGHMVRIGRDRSGCNLDGVEWDQMPDDVLRQRIDAMSPEEVHAELTANGIDVTDALARVRKAVDAARNKKCWK